MSYNKTTWQTGDKITAAKMNKIEDGIAAAEQSGGGNPVAHVTWEGFSAGGYSLPIRFYVCEYDSIEDIYQAKELYLRLNNDGSCETRNILEYFFAAKGSGDFYIGDLPNVPSGMFLCIDDHRWDGGTNTSFSGNVSEDSVIVNFGSTTHARIVTGDFSMTIVKL